MAKKTKEQLLREQFERIGLQMTELKLCDFAGFNDGCDFSFSKKPGDALKTIGYQHFFNLMESLPDKAGEKLFWKKIDTAYQLPANLKREKDVKKNFKKKYWP